MRLLGATMERVEPGRVEIALPFRPDLSQEQESRRTHCATGTQTLMSLVGRAGVKD